LVGVRQFGVCTVVKVKDPNLAKSSEQPVLSLGVEAARPDLSVGRGVCEPQCESVKRLSPVTNEMRKPIPCRRSQAAMGVRQLAERAREDARILRFRRGQRAWRVHKGVHTYLRDLPSSEEKVGLSNAEKPE